MDIGLVLQNYLEHHDEYFPVIVGLRGVKRAQSDAPGAR